MNNFHQTQQEDYKEKSHPHPHPHLASYPFIPSWSLDTAQWASLGVEMDKTPGVNFLDILCCK